MCSSDLILVTTKKGSKKDGFGIRYSGNFTWTNVAETLDMQRRYGQGHINTAAMKILKQSNFLNI